MARPYIEMHYTYVFHGRESQAYETCLRGTSFEQMFEQRGLLQFEPKPGKLQWPSWAWPGGYEIHYYAKDGGVLCHGCVNEEIERTFDKDDDQFYVVASDINYEDGHLHCDHCNRQIAPAYGFCTDDLEDTP